jgi:hypothetical protein
MSIGLPARNPGAALTVRRLFSALVAVVVLAVAMVGCTPASTSAPSLGPVATASIEAPASGSPAP